LSGLRFGKIVCGLALCFVSFRSRFTTSVGRRAIGVYAFGYGRTVCAIVRDLHLLRGSIAGRPIRVMNVAVFVRPPIYLVSECGATDRDRNCDEC
jgi:hypothetical protein